MYVNIQYLIPDYIEFVLLSPAYLPIYARPGKHGRVPAVFSIISSPRHPYIVRDMALLYMKFYRYVLLSITPHNYIIFSFFRQVVLAWEADAIYNKCECIMDLFGLFICIKKYSIYL